MTWLGDRPVTSATIREYAESLETPDKVNTFLVAAKYNGLPNIKIPAKTIKAATERYYEQRWNAYLDWLGEGKPLTSKTIANYVEETKNKHYSHATINAFLNAAAYFAPSYITIPPKEYRPNVKRMPKLTATELDYFKRGIPTLKPDQQEEIRRLLRGEKPQRRYAAYYFLVQRLGLMTLGRSVAPSQITGLERQNDAVG
ncbi:hypothetical protein CEB3_c18890 [Peptococcaceae bacterium CEB3]|nr:hypothetical protein CEB3_c18890 [Peptococcaceae bacterium CEB3]